MSERQRPNTRSRGRVDSDTSANTQRTEERLSHGQPPRDGPLDPEPRPVNPESDQLDGEQPVDPVTREGPTDPESHQSHEIQANPALNVGDTPTVTSSLGQAERLAQLEREVTARRVTQRIRELEQELAGGPAVEDTIGGISHTKRKRNADHEDENLYRHIKFSEAPTFGGKNQKELREFTQAFTDLFAWMEYGKEADESRRIKAAAVQLRGRAREAWQRKEANPKTWKEFITFCSNIIADPVVRRANASFELKDIKQGPTQSVRDLIRQIEQIETDVPSEDEEEKKAWHLLNALRPEVRTAVLHDLKHGIKSRDQVLSQAQFYENAKKSEVEDSKSENSKSESQFGKSHPKSGRNAKDSQDEDNHASSNQQGSRNSRRRPKFTGTCNKCGKIGHKEAECHSNDKSNGNAGQSKGNEQKKAQPAS